MNKQALSCTAAAVCAMGLCGQLAWDRARQADGGLDAEVDLGVGRVRRPPGAAAQQGDDGDEQQAGQPHPGAHLPGHPPLPRVLVGVADQRRRVEGPPQPEDQQDQGQQRPAPRQLPAVPDSVGGVKQHLIPHRQGIDLPPVSPWCVPDVHRLPGHHPGEGLSRKAPAAEPVGEIRPRQVKPGDIIAPGAVPAGGVAVHEVPVHRARGGLQRRLRHRDPAGDLQGQGPCGQGGDEQGQRQGGQELPYRGAALPVPAHQPAQSPDGQHQSGQQGGQEKDGDEYG